MKVLQVISSFPPAYAYGGPVKSAHKLSMALQERGHKVTVFTTDVKDADSRVAIDENPTTIDGLEVYRFRNLSNALAWKLRITTAFGMARGLNRRIDDFDVVHLHDCRSIESYLTYRYATKHGVPYMLQPRGTLPRQSKTAQKRLFDALVGKTILREADAVLASSQSESRQYSEVFPGVEFSVEHVPNGIDIGDFRPLPDSGQFRSKYDIEKGSSLVLFLGRLHDRKGGDLLISAFSRFKETHPDAHLVFVGPDEGAKPDWKRRVAVLGLSEDVLFTGPLYGDDKLAAYRDADVFVLSSTDRHESFGNVVLEALACGTPAVVTEVCGVAEYLPGRFCTCVEPSINDVATGIRKLIAEPNPDTEAIISFLSSELSWTAVAEQTESVYGSMLETEEYGESASLV